MLHLHFKVRLLIFFAALLCSQTAISGERFSVGVSGGAALTDLMGRLNGQSEAKHWTVGPIVEIRLPSSFALEVSALYRRTGFTSEFYLLGSTITRVRANSWEFPMLVKYYVAGENAFVRPYISGGYVLRYLSNARATAVSVYPPGLPHTDYYEYGLHSNPSHGMVFGGGVSFKTGPIRIAPGIRYTGWFTSPFDVSGSHGFTVKSAENQLDLLVNVTF